jgi:hypothetical protein
VVNGIGIGVLEYLISSPPKEKRAALCFLANGFT